MKVPNKIYLFPYEHTGEHDLGVTFCGTAFRECIESENRPCYIRKNALLEWANDNLLECKVSNDDADYGRIDVYEKLIDKLNSL